MIHSACEYILYAKENGMAVGSLTFSPAKTFSPYMECLPTIINQITFAEDKKVEVNPFYRYEEIFSELFAMENEEILSELKDFIFDFWIHEIFEIECLAEMTQKSFTKSRLICEIVEGFFGEKISKYFGLFQENEQDAVINQVLNLYSGGDCGVLFCNALKAVFSDIYVYTLNSQKILLYIGEKESSVSKKKIDFLKDIFLPIGTQIDIFWNKHFGIFEVKETMILDELILI